MKFRHPAFRPLALAAAGLLAHPAFAAEGMWTLDNLPRAQMQARYGFNPDAAWVDKAMHSSVRLAGGCSGSFISPDGLVMTNHHCAVGCIQQLSSPTIDRVANGFLARTREQELACPEIELNRLEAMIDVTEAVRAATAGKEGAAFHAAEDAVRARLTRECRGADVETVRCDLVTLYHGGQYQLYKYHRFSDVRLVWAPEEPIADFGGDPDNFNFPRFDLDATFLRAYEGGKPAAVRDWFRFKPEGPQAGELTLVLGHPGRTQRQLTVAQLETARDDMALRTIPALSETRGSLGQYSKIDAEATRLANRPLHSTENRLKVLNGQLLALLDPSMLAAKRQAEKTLQDFVAARPELAARVGDPWSAIERAQRAKRSLEPGYSMVEEGQAFAARHFEYARLLVRGAIERSKPNDQRLREYVDTSLPQLEQRLRSRAPVYPAYETARLGWSLTRMRAVLGPDDAIVKQVLGLRSPDQVAQALVAGSQLGNPAERMQLWKGGQAAIEQSDDPFIRFVVALEPASRALRQRYETEVRAVETEAAQRIAIASFAQTGKGAYPDATFSLRLSYGEVQGWDYKGQPVPPFTDFGGAYRRSTGEAPFVLPASWVAAQRQLNPAQRFDYVTTNDIIGGNSGSPVLNRAGEVVGLAFDGNTPSHGGAYYFDERVNRTVAVHSGAIIAALRQVYQADALVTEILDARP